MAGVERNLSDEKNPPKVLNFEKASQLAKEETKDDNTKMTDQDNVTQSLALYMLMSMMKETAVMTVIRKIPSTGIRRSSLLTVKTLLNRMTVYL